MTSAVRTDQRGEMRVEVAQLLPPSIERGVYNSISQLRFLFKGNLDHYKQAFKTAYEADDYYVAIAIAHAYKGSVLGNDNEARDHSYVFHQDFPLAKLDKEFTLFSEMFKICYSGREIPPLMFLNYTQAAHQGLVSAKMVCVLRSEKLGYTMKPMAEQGVREAQFYYGIETLFDDFKTQASLHAENPNNIEFVEGSRLMWAMGLYYLRASGMGKIMPLGNEKVGPNRVAYNGMIVQDDGTIYCNNRDVDKWTDLYASIKKEAEPAQWQWCVYV